jgi:hypothetical protein
MATKLPKLISGTLILTAFFWIFMLGRTTFSVWRYLHMTVDPSIAASAHRYIITSSLQVVLFTVFATILSLTVRFDRSASAACGLVLLFLVAIWHYFFAGTSILFRPPLGDGSWSRALSTYYRLHSGFLGLHVFQSALLFTLLVLWVLSLLRLRASNRIA